MEKPDPYFPVKVWAPFFPATFTWLEHSLSKFPFMALALMCPTSPCILSKLGTSRKRPGNVTRISHFPSMAFIPTGNRAGLLIYGGMSSDCEEF